MNNAVAVMRYSLEVILTLYVIQFIMRSIQFVMRPTASSL